MRFGPKLEEIFLSASRSFLYLSGTCLKAINPSFLIPNFSRKNKKFNDYLHFSVLIIVLEFISESPERGRNLQGNNFPNLNPILDQHTRFVRKCPLKHKQELVSGREKVESFFIAMKKPRKRES